MLEIYIRNPAFKDLISGTKKYELRLLKGILQGILKCRVRSFNTKKNTETAKP